MNSSMRKIRKKLAARYYKRFGFCSAVLLFLIAVIGPIVPDKSYSSSEKRNLSAFPELTADTLLDASFMDGMEDYLADQFAARDFWMGLRTSLDRITGKVESQGVYLCEDGYLMERFDGADEENRELTEAAILGFGERYPDMNMYFMLVPNSILINRQLLKKNALTEDQDAYIDAFYDGIASGVRTLDVRDALKKASETTQVYYRTDHHWTTDGAYAAYQAAAEAMGLPADTPAYESRVVCNDFSGSLVSKSGFLTDKKDCIRVYFPMDQAVDYVVTYDEETLKTASCYQTEFLKDDDPYQLFFGGNHPQITIETTADTNRKLLVFKDSYANCFLPFLLSGFKQITVVDPRYYYSDIDALAAANGYTDVLYLYNANTLAADNNLRLVLENE